MASEPPNSIEFPEDTPLPRAPRRQVVIHDGGPPEEPPRSVRHRVAHQVRKAAPSNGAQWITSICAIIVAMGGGAGMREFLSKAPLPPPPMTADQADALIGKVDELTKKVDAANTNRISYDWAVYDALKVRGDIADGLLCKMNQGKSFARKVRCDTIPVDDWESVPLEKQFIGPFKVSYDWPPIPTPPDRRPR